MSSMRITVFDTPDVHNAAMQAAALTYAAHGWPVFPTCAPWGDGKCTHAGKARWGKTSGTWTRVGTYERTCDSPGKHPLVQWKTHATCDPATIGRWGTGVWWGRRTFNLGLATGATSGVLLLDIDPKHGGEESLARLEEIHGALPDTAQVRTGSGGAHLYFAYPTHTPIRNSAGVYLGAGLDIRGEGGYAVLPPSLHMTGGVYVWVEGKSPDQTGLAEAPDWLLGLLQRPAPVRTGVTLEGWESPHTAGGPIPEGTRNDRLFLIASSMRGRGADEDQIRTELAQVNALRCDPPLDEEDLHRITGSVMRYTPGRRGVSPAEPSQTYPAEPSQTYAAEPSETYVAEIIPTYATEEV